MLHIDIPNAVESQGACGDQGRDQRFALRPTEPLRERERQNRIMLKDLAVQALQQS